MTGRVRRKRIKLVLDANSHEEAKTKLKELWDNITNSKTRFDCDTNHLKYITTLLTKNLDDAYLLYFYRSLHLFKYLEKFPIQHDFIKKALLRILTDKGIDPLSAELSIKFNV